MLKVCTAITGNTTYRFVIHDPDAIYVLGVDRAVCDRCPGMSQTRGIFEAARGLGECVEASAILVAHGSHPK
jgi:hypothetical protein